MQPGWLFLSFAVGGGILWRSDLTHFTWWQLIQFAFYCALAAFNKHERYVLAFVSQALLTILGVVAMSIAKCKLLNDAADTWGAAYVVLNFLVHYAPLLIAYAAPPSLPPHKPALQLVQGLAFFLVYVGHHNSAAVYGCDLPTWPIVLGTTVVTCLLCIPTVLKTVTKMFTASPAENVQGRVYAAFAHFVGF